MSDLRSYYENESHETLYNQLQNGDPAAVEAASADWSTVSGTLDDISTALTRDLASLNEKWSSDSGDEFSRRVTVIAQFASDNAELAGQVKLALTSFAADLKTAQAKVDDPADTDDNTSTWGGALTGGAVAGVPGAVVGAVWGHNRDEEQREKAKARTVELISNLAGDYQMSWSGGSVQPPIAPADLPGSVDNDGPGSASGPGATNVSGLGGTGTSSSSGSGRAGAPDSPSLVSDTGTPGDRGDTTGGGPSTSVGDVTGGGGNGTGLSAATPGIGTGTGTGTGLGTGGGGGGGGGGDSLGGGGLALGGLAAGAGGLAAGALGLGNSGQSARPGGAGSSAMKPGGNTGTGAGKGTGAAGGGKDRLGVPRQGVGGVDGHHGLQNRNAAGAKGAQSAAGGRGLTGEDEDADDRTTWLTEDDMVWGQDGSAPPPVLGGR
ncbi:uncharacterized protein YukE [Catenuloplanes nepalensis]|uniref:Uncharacterized protein YukE n=1 Tax=Catenuloplanes nepalensis TaxID=587533 RepID=A0ABT9N1L6_9ACTN|nr:hypothetical protein [Catenuloplanes nepalensis]MDP9797592.1 uncharacterized protein YukE [Catenuloplanes nepalensis]